jgi:hypothetical protein
MKKAFEIAKGLMAYDFALPVAYQNKKFKGEQIAEWANMFIEDYGMFHMISIDKRKIKSEHDLIESFLHELVHAIQYETKRDVDHAEFFCKYVAYFRKLGYNIESADCDLNLIIKAIENENETNENTKTRIY